jgi:hypothetical protein
LAAPLRELDPLLRDPPDERDDVERDELELLPDFARVAAPLRAAVLRLAAARLRVLAPFFAAAERDFELDPPRTLLSSSSARPRNSSTVPRTSLGELLPASAIARATRLRIPLARSLLKRSLSRPDLAIRLLLRRLQAGCSSTRLRKNLRTGAQSARGEGFVKRAWRPATMRAGGVF